MSSFLFRNKNYTRRPPSKEAKKVYIFCEGEKEVRYFKYFQGLSSNINIIPISNQEGKSDPVKLKENAEKYFIGKTDLSEYKDEVWFVIDTDEWNKNNKIDTLKDFCAGKNTDTNRWQVTQSNPSFEVWLYYHFNTEKPQQKEVMQFPTFKAFCNKKIGGNGFHISRDSRNIIQAIINAEKHYTKDTRDQPILYTTEVHFLAKTIEPFIIEALFHTKQ